MAFYEPQFEKKYIKTIHHKPYAAIDTASALKDTAKGRTVLVTGAGRGIGQGIALAFAEAGASTVIVSSRSQAELQSVASKIEKLGAKALAIPTDITSQESVAALFAKLDQDGISPDIICLNAGACEKLGPLHEADPQEWVRVWDVQIKGLFYPAREAIKRHVERTPQKELFILVTTSNATFITVPGLSAYQPSKSAQQRVIEFINAEYKDQNVHIVGFHPGAVATELVAGMQTPPEFDSLFVDDPALAGKFSVWLSATKEARKLDGRFVSATWDVTDILKAIQEGAVDGPDTLQLRL